MRGLQERWVVLTALTDPARSDAAVHGTWRRLLIPAVAVGVVAADQVTKNWALDHLRDGPRHVVGPVNLVLTFNPGAAFNLGTGVTPIVEAVVVALIVLLLLFSRRASRNASVLSSIGLGLLLGGALGNLSDRVFRHHHGAVVDFIQAAGWWPVFNLADACIVVAILLLALANWADPRRVSSRG